MQLNMEPPRPSIVTRSQSAAEAAVSEACLEGEMEDSNLDCPSRLTAWIESLKIVRPWRVVASLLLITHISVIGYLICTLNGEQDLLKYLFAFLTTVACGFKSNSTDTANTFNLLCSLNRLSIDLPSIVPITAGATISTHTP